MGQFAEVLHLPPREVERLTVAEFDALADYLARRGQQQKGAGGG